MMVIAVEAVGTRHNPHIVEAELGVEREQIMVVTRQSGEVIDEHGVELMSSRSRQERLQARPILENSRLRLILIDVSGVHHVPARRGEFLAAPPLVINALGALVV